MTKHYWDVFIDFPEHHLTEPCHYLQAHFDGNQFPASGWWDLDDEWEYIEEV